MNIWASDRLCGVVWKREEMLKIYELLQRVQHWDKVAGARNGMAVLNANL